MMEMSGIVFAANELELRRFRARRVGGKLCGTSVTNKGKEALMRSSSRVHALADRDYSRLARFSRRGTSRAEQST